MRNIALKPNLSLLLCSEFKSPYQKSKTYNEHIQCTLPSLNARMADIFKKQNETGFV